MKVLGVEKRGIYVALEFGLAELQNMKTFLEKAILLYDHVHGDTEKELIVEIIEFERQLETTIKEIAENES